MPCSFLLFVAGLSQAAASTAVLLDPFRKCHRKAEELLRDGWPSFIHASARGAAMETAKLLL